MQIAMICKLYYNNICSFKKNDYFCKKFITMFNRLYIVLKEKNIRQDVLAKYFNIPPARISRWCNNISQPSWEALQLISDFLKVDISYLVYGTPKTIPVKGDVDLSSLGVNDAFLQIVVGKTNLQNIQGAFFRLNTDFGNGRMESYPLSLIGYVSLYQNPKIPIIEIGEVIENCSLTKLKIENCKEELKLTFLCPSFS
jgi:transcriptional regulator with XRE-family HTH domain